MKPMRALAVAGLALGLLAGCGDDDGDGLSKSGYIARANASCEKHERRAEAAFGRIVGGGRPTAAEAQRFLSEAVVPALRDGSAERAKLPAPEGDEDKIRAINAAARRTVADFTRIASDRTRSRALMNGRLPDPATEVTHPTGATASTSAAEASEVANPKGVIERQLAAFNSHDVHALSFSASVRLEAPGARLDDREQAQAFVLGFWAAFPTPGCT